MSLRPYLAICAVLGVCSLQLARAQVNQVIFQVGTEDGGQGEFSQETNSNDPPGSPTDQDDDFYFAGTYPDPIGVVSETEPWKNYDRALTPGDPRNRIHFNLDASTASPTNDLKLTVSYIALGSVDVGNGTHDIVMRFNGLDIFSTNEVAAPVRVEQTVKAADVGAQVGENIIEIERTGGTASSWIQFDFVRLEIPAADSDGDGLPDSYEKRYPTVLNPNDNTDAAKDSDSDGLTNLEEFTAGTDPSKADTDGDGLNDGDEVKTVLSNPLAPDSDKDGLTDAEEVNQYKTNPNNPDSDGDSLTDKDEIQTTKTDPNLADTDGDGSSDALEIQLGADPKDPASKPIPFTPLWLLGIADNSQAEFTQEVGGSPEAPGSPDALDDDYYFAGDYPDTVGPVAADEPFSNFERALTDGNTFSRIHFNLTSAQVKTNSEYLLTFNLVQLGSGGGPSVHDISFRFNGNEFHKETQLNHAKKVEEIVKAPDVKAVAGENVIELERTGGSGAAWIQFDYIQADYREVTANPNADSDRDGMTDANEALAGTDPKDPNSNLHVLSVKPGAAGIEINWSSVAGKKYIIEYSPSLAKNSWVTVSAVDSGGAATKFTDTDAGRLRAAAGYYRIRLSQ